MVSSEEEDSSITGSRSTVADGPRLVSCGRVRVGVGGLKTAVTHCCCFEIGVERRQTMSLSSRLVRAPRQTQLLTRTDREGKVSAVR
jgi:hypothetical protein